MSEPGDLTAEELDGLVLDDLLDKALYYDIRNPDEWDRAKEQFASLVAMARRAAPRWIPVEERLPDESVLSLVTVAWPNSGHPGVTSYPSMGSYRHGRWGLDAETSHLEDEVVTHWMPLPDPPEVKP